MESHELLCQELSVMSRPTSHGSRLPTDCNGTVINTKFLRQRLAADVCHVRVRVAESEHPRLEHTTLQLSPPDFKLQTGHSQAISFPSSAYKGQPAFQPSWPQGCPRQDRKQYILINVAPRCRYNGRCSSTAPVALERIRCHACLDWQFSPVISASQCCESYKMLESYDASPTQRESWTNYSEGRLTRSTHRNA